MLDAVHQASSLFGQILTVGVFIVLAVVVIIAFGYELQTKKKVL
jgi:hypothetical protein